MHSEEQIIGRYQQVLNQIARAAFSAGRDPDQVKLVVVTKGHSIEAVRAVVKAGARRLGENYLDEAIEKIDSIHTDAPIEWHMIGHIQSRKARPIAEYFQWVHSVDRVKLAQKLSDAAVELKCTLPVLLECNVSGESSKFGFPAWEDHQFYNLYSEIETILQLPGIGVRGLMTMAPYFPDAEQARPLFRRLRSIAQTLRRRFPEATWDELSMGMSGDYIVAVEEGATLVRIGTAILGERVQTS